MKFGVCAEISAADTLADAGYDYIELSVASDLIPDSGTAEWAEKRHAIERMPLLPEAFNSFVRAHKIVGPSADRELLRRYIQTAMRRASEVGGKIIVLGSGGARAIPDDFPRAKAIAQFLAFLEHCADCYAETDVTIVIEPLQQSETNLIHLVSEGADFARQIDRPGVRCLADTFHMEREEEELKSIVDAADVLAHVHTADTGRFAPGTGVYDHTALFRSLHAARYDARLSIEGTIGDDYAEQVRQSLHHLKAAYAAV